MSRHVIQAVGPEEPIYIEYIKYRSGVVCVTEMWVFTLGGGAFLRHLSSPPTTISKSNIDDGRITMQKTWIHKMLKPKLSRTKITGACKSTTSYLHKLFALYDTRHNV